MFTGEYHCVIDEKNRMAIPSVIRKCIENGDNSNVLYITIGMDQCLAIYPEHEFEELVNNRIKQLPLTNKKARIFQRLFFSNAHTLEQWDKQGRIVIPQKLKDLATLDREVVIIGILNRIELWDRKLWDAFIKENEGKFEEIAEDITNIY
ncbi:MAG: division/cell wall cluster transcriptional repressor MraZ [Candidatus Anammoxibacter sp.]